MKTRVEAVRFVLRQFEDGVEFPPELKKEIAWHYGRQELKQLMDFIYEGPPQLGEEIPQIRKLK